MDWKRELGDSTYLLLWGFSEKKKKSIQDMERDAFSKCMPLDSNTSRSYVQLE